MKMLDLINKSMLIEIICRHGKFNLDGIYVSENSGFYVIIMLYQHILTGIMYAWSLYVKYKHYVC